MEEGAVTKVLHDFMTVNDGELCLKKGDIVQILNKIDRHWCYGISNEKNGNVAISNLILVEIPALDNDNKLFAAIADFPGQQLGDLSFNRGELIVGMNEVDENWWHGKIEDVRVGIFPTTYTWQLNTTILKKLNCPTVTNLIACVKMDMKAQLEEEMDLHKGDIIKITEVIDKEWYRGECGGKNGIFPSSYVTILDESDNMESRSRRNMGQFDEPDNNRILLSQLDEDYSVHKDSMSHIVSNYNLQKQSNFESNNTECDDLSILEDDYFRQNMPTMFKPNENVHDKDRSTCTNLLFDSPPCNELDIVPYGITLYPFYAQFDNELSFHEGEIVKLTRHISKDWIEGKIDDRKGIFPSNYVNIIVDCKLDPDPSISRCNSSCVVENLNYPVDSTGITLETNTFAIVLYNFDMQMNSDLTVKEGEIVCIVKQVNQDWCEVKNLSGNIGLCPRNYLSPYVIPNKITTDNMHQDCSNKLYQPNIELSDVNRRHYESHDFQECDIYNSSDNLDELIFKNLDNLQLRSSWNSKSSNKRVTLDEVSVEPTSNASVANNTEEKNISWRKQNSLENLSANIEDHEVDRFKAKHVESTWNEGEIQQPVIQSSSSVSTTFDVPVQEAKDSDLELDKYSSNVSSEGILNPCRSAPPVPDVELRTKSGRRPVRQLTLDRVPHRPAPPIPLPGQEPVRRSISRKLRQFDGSDDSCFEQKMSKLRSIITAKENQLEYLNQVKEETLTKIDSLEEPVDETVQDMKYRVMKYDEKINFLMADLERLKGSLGKDNNFSISQKEECGVQMQPPVDCSSSANVEYTEEDRRKRNLEQRQNVISELVFTEKEYVRDLKITYETFNLHNPGILESRGIDVKEVFGNMAEVMLLAEDFLDKLLFAMKGKEDEEQCIGPCFLDLADQMKTVYGQYCMNHEAALSLLEKYEENDEIQNIFKKGIETLRYQIVCFDMGSILIKPVQRILKYPLILNELIKCTEDTHKDKPELLKAVKTIMEVAAYINEYKRRKDIVSKYLEDGNATISSRVSKLSLHSVAKKSTRFSALVTSSLGFGAVTKDPIFQEQEVIFQSIEKTIRIFLRNVEVFLNHMHEVVVSQYHNAEAISLFVQDRNQEVEEFCRVQKLIANQFWKEFEKCVQLRVTTPLTILVELFEGPGILIQKCHDKFLDYAACHTKAEKNKDIRLVQEELLNAKNNYEALNTHLLEELPTLIDLASELFVECLSAFVTSKKLLSGKITKQYLYLLEQSKESSLSNPIDAFTVKHNLALNQLNRFSFLRKSVKVEQTGKGLRKNSPTSQMRQSSSENISQINQAQGSSQRAYLQSHYGPNMLYQVRKSYVQNEPMEMTVNEGYLVAVIKKQNPMGDTSIWFVDDGASKGFIPSNILELLSSSPTMTNPQARNTSSMSTTVSNRSSLSSLSTASGRTSDDSSSADISLPSFEDSKEYSTVNSSQSTLRNVSLESRLHLDDVMKHVYEEIPSENHSLNEGVLHELHPSSGNFYYAMYDFDSTGANILSIKRGQVVKVLQHQDLQDNSDWWFVEDRFGASGFVPRNFLGRYTQA